MSTECEKNTCPCGLTCQNRRFQLHQDACVYPKYMGAKGFGLIAGEKIKKGQFIIQYIGEVLSLKSEEGIKRLNDYSKSTCTYMMKLGGSEVIDPSYKGNMARFINHSCDPNCETQKWNVLGEICVGIFAVRDIQIGEELSFNYQFDVYQTPFTRCLCGAWNCKKYLGLVPTEYTPEEWFDKVDKMPCEICGSNDADFDDQFLLCDNCNAGYHTFCLEPKLDKIPDGAWFCPRCVIKQDKENLSESAEPQADDAKKMEAENMSLAKILKKDKIKKDQNKKMRLLKISKKKKTGRPRKKRSIDNDLDGVSDYQEFYNFQKELQKSLIQQINKDALLDLVDQEEEAQEEEVEAEPEPEVFEEKVEKKSKLDQIREQVMIHLKKLFSQTKILDNLKKKEFLEKLNENQELKRRNMSISTLELIIFRKYIFKKTKKLKIRLSLDTNPYKRDIFAKKNEFRIQCNDEQYDFFRDIFNLMEKAVAQYRQINGFTTAAVKVPAIFLKRIVGEYQKNVHYLQSQYQVLLEYDKSYITDECYPLSLECKVSLKGIKDNIVDAVQYLQEIIDELEVRRIYMSSSDIKIIIANLMPLKQQIHPSEIRCCRDNALRDINHPFYTIYYKDKEVAFVGTKEELDKSTNLVENEIAREKQIKKSIFSLNFLIPVCDKYHLIKIKENIEKVYDYTKLIIYDPLIPRKNVSLTLVSNYNNFPKAYDDLKQKIDDRKLFRESFENYQKQTIYQMTKYFFKYLQNYFQTESTIFMKAWDTMTLDFLGRCNQYPSTFKEILSLYIRDHELKFYILSVTQMCSRGGYKNIGLTKNDVITICKLMINKVVYYDSSLFSRNYQSIFSFDSELPNFLEYYNPKTYFDYYSPDKVPVFEKNLRDRLMTSEEIENDSNVQFPKKISRYSPRKKYNRKSSREMVTGSSRYPRRRSYARHNSGRYSRPVFNRSSQGPIKRRFEEVRKSETPSKKKSSVESVKKPPKMKDKDPRRQKPVKKTPPSESKSKSLSSKSSRRRKYREKKSRRKQDYTQIRSRSRTRIDPRKYLSKFKKSPSSSSSSKSSSRKSKPLLTFPKVNDSKSKSKSKSSSNSFEQGEMSKRAKFEKNNASSRYFPYNKKRFSKRSRSSSGSRKERRVNILFETKNSSER